MSEKYHGMYLGIVIQNNDPDKEGKIKVYIPHISADVYENWYEIKKNKAFKFIGRNLDSDLNDIIETLKDRLPWANCAMPLVGQNTPGRYNAHLEVGTISDSNNVDNITPVPDYTPDVYSLNKDGIGEKPARKYEVDSHKLNDAFQSAEEDELNGVRRPNKYSYNYTPNSYSNSAKGSFGIPNVGSHVWTFFQDGHPLSPVYFAAAYDKNAWQSIYDNRDSDGIDYPGAYENLSKADDPTYDHNVETYRNKYVLNQKGGTLEIVNTDNREILKMTHYSGSFKEFNNYTNIELATTNDQKLVLEDQYLTVKGFRNVYTERDLDYIIRGDAHKKIGYQNTKDHEQWREAARKLADVKQLFEIQRTTGGTAFNSPHQKRCGKSAPCPVCNPSSIRSDSLWQVRNKFGSTGVPVRKAFRDGVGSGDTISWGKRVNPELKKWGECKDPPLGGGAQAKALLTVNSNIAADQIAKSFTVTDTMGIIYEFIYNPLLPAVADGTPKDNSGTRYMFGIEKNDLIATAERIKTAVNMAPTITAEVCEDSNVVVITQTVPGTQGHQTNDASSLNPAITITGFDGCSLSEIFGELCPVCGGTGESPSSMDGTWNPDPRKTDVEWKKLLDDAVGNLADIEKALGDGGSEVVNISKHKIETIGVTINDFGSIRIDPVGKMHRDAVVVANEGVFNSRQPSTLIEYVHVDDLPGGSSTLNVCNRWNINVGAGGISMKSYGPVDIGGTIVNVAGEQVNIGSQNEVVIDGGKRLELVADILTIRNRKNKQVLIDSNLGVSQNVVIGGGLHVEGELSVQHITAPVEIQETEQSEVYGKLLTDLSFGCLVNGFPATIVLTSDSNDDRVRVYDHSHHFKNLPLHLKKSNDGVRKKGKLCNEPGRVTANRTEVRMAKDKAT